MSFFIHTMDSSATPRETCQKHPLPPFSKAMLIAGRHVREGTRPFFFLIHSFSLFIYIFFLLFFCPVQSIVSVSRRLLHFIIYPPPLPATLVRSLLLVKFYLRQYITEFLTVSGHYLRQRLLSYSFSKPLALASLKQLLLFFSLLFFIFILFFPTMRVF